MDSITNSFGDVLLWSFWFFIWFGAVIAWFRCLMDLFGDSSLSGWAKAGWIIVLVFLPWIGVLIYLIARGRSMSERRVAAMSAQQAATDEYIRGVADTRSSGVEDIVDAKALLDAGTITQSEFESIKVKALA
jgi:hypothetical protein